MSGEVSENKVKKKQVTWTFQPADEVEKAVYKHFTEELKRPIRQSSDLPRAVRSKFINDALRHELPEEIKAIRVERRAAEDAALEKFSFVESKSDNRKAGLKILTKKASHSPAPSK